MTTTPELPAPAVDTAAVDTALDQRAVTTADMIAGAIAANMLDHVGQPRRLPELQWPGVDPALVQEIFSAGAAVGYRAGKLVAAPRWEPETLDRLRAALEEDGYRLMARRVGVTAAHGRARDAGESVRGERR